MELQRLYFKAESIIKSDMSWEEKYELIFSPEISQKVFEIVRFDYYDPDTTYEEDVMAFYNAFKQHLWG